jgi:Aspartyl protease
MRCWLITAILICLLFPGKSRSDIYYWKDSRGIQNYTGSLESIPEEYRAQAQLLSLSPAPAPPPELPPVSPNQGSTKIPFSPGSPVLVQARINGLGPITLILDTGAEGTIISPAVLTRLGRAPENGPPLTLKGVTGTGYASRVWVDFIEVGQTRVGPLLVAVYEADLRGADGLLGRDFLSHLKVTIDSKEKVVTLTPN